MKSTFVICLTLTCMSATHAWSQQSAWQNAVQRSTRSFVLKDVAKLNRGLKRGESRIDWYQEGTKYFFTDIDGDTDLDAVVQYSIEGSGSGTGQILMLVFKNVNGKPVYEWRTDFHELDDLLMKAGHTIKTDARGGASILSVSGNHISIEAASYFQSDNDADSDAMCCPSMKATVVFTYAKHKLAFERVAVPLRRVME